MLSTAETVSEMALSKTELLCALPFENVRPIRASRFLSSGWKRMSSAIKPSSAALRRT